MKHILLVVTAAFLFQPLAGLADTFIIFAFGDSITQGLKRDAAGNEWGITSPANGARVGGYEPPLESKFSQSTKHTAYVYNWGVGGEWTEDGVNRIDGVLSSRSAQFILIMEGANNIISYGDGSANQVKFDLGVMIDKARASGVEPILATVTPISGRNTPALNDLIKGLAIEKNVLLADQYTAINSNLALYGSGDGIHINATGDDKMADTWMTTLKRNPLVWRFNIAPIFLLLLN